MIVLGISTAASVGGVALAGSGTGPLRRDLGERGRHAEALLPAAEGLLGEAGLGWRDVGLVAVDVGPGSFTGVRVGVAAALGLSEAGGIPAAGVGSLDILAWACYHATRHAVGGYMICAADVRRGEVVLGRYRVTLSGPVREGDEALMRVDGAGDPPPGGTFVVADAPEALWPGAPLVRVEIGGPERAASAAGLGRTAFESGSAAAPEPRYARPADARPRRP